MGGHRAHYDCPVTHQTPQAQSVPQEGAVSAGPTTALYEDDRALDVLGYVTTLRRFLLPAVLVAALVLALGLAWTFTRAPGYRAEATVLLVPAAVTSEAEATQQAAMLPMVARSYAQMANTDLVLGPVAKASGDSELKGRDLAAKLTVGYPANSLLIRFTYDSTDPQETADTVNAIADSYVKQVPAFGPGQGNNVSLGAKVISRPTEPIDPQPSTRTQNLALSLIASLASGLLTALALDLLLGRRWKFPRRS